VENVVTISAVARQSGDVYVVSATICMSGSVCVRVSVITEARIVTFAYVT
jgi:hypothetical protein